MRKSRFTEAQIIAILKEAEGGVKVADPSLDKEALKSALSKRW